MIPELKIMLNESLNMVKLQEKKNKQLTKQGQGFMSAGEILFVASNSIHVGTLLSHKKSLLQEKSSLIPVTRVRIMKESF